MEEFGFPHGTPVPNIARSNGHFRGDCAKAMGTWVDTACERACSANGVAKEGIPCLPSTLCMRPLRGNHNLTSHTSSRIGGVTKYEPIYTPRVVPTNWPSDCAWDWQENPVFGFVTTGNEAGYGTCVSNTGGAFVSWMPCIDKWHWQVTLGFRVTNSLLQNHESKHKPGRIYKAPLVIQQRLK